MIQIKVVLEFTVPVRDEWVDLPKIEQEKISIMHLHKDGYDMSDGVVLEATEIKKDES